MPYTPTHTFVAGNVIDPLEVEANLDGIDQYTRGDAVAADFAANSFDQTHLMKGQYEPLTNQYKFISGIVGSRVYTTQQQNVTGWSYTTNGMRVPANPQYNWLSNTSINFYLEETSDVLFQWFGAPLLTDLGTSQWRAARFFLTFDGNVKNNSLTKSFSEVLLPYESRLYCSSFWLEKQVPAGWHSLGVKGYTTETEVCLMSWGVTMEAFYQIPAGDPNPPEDPNDPFDPSLG